MFDYTCRQRPILRTNDIPLCGRANTVHLLVPLMVARALGSAQLVGDLRLSPASRTAEAAVAIDEFRYPTASKHHARPHLLGGNVQRGVITKAAAKCPDCQTRYVLWCRVGVVDRAHIARASLIQRLRVESSRTSFRPRILQRHDGSKLPTSLRHEMMQVPNCSIRAVSREIPA